MRRERINRRGAGKVRGQMEVVTVKLSKLKPDKRNARGHNRRNVEAIKESLEAFGQHRPFGVQKSTGKIIVGNGMFAAMKELGWTEGAVYYVDDDEAESVKRALADNRTGELAEWNMDALGEIFSEFDGEALIGWTDEERAALMNGGEEELPKEQPFREVFSILIECGSEAQQEELYNEFIERGLKCRVQSF